MEGLSDNPSGRPNRRSKTDVDVADGGSRSPIGNDAHEPTGRDAAASSDDVYDPDGASVHMRGVDPDRGGGRRRRPRGEGRESPSSAAQSTPKAGTEAQAKDICLRLLTDRARSRAELADKLAAKGFAPEVAERALNRLAEVGLIDDAAFAEQWVHSRHTFSGKGKKVLAQELRRKGVSDSDAESALAAITPADESARAADLVRRKLAALPQDLPIDTTTNRLVGMLARRGYNQSMAYAVVAEELRTVAESTAVEHDSDDTAPNRAMVNRADRLDVDGQSGDGIAGAQPATSRRPRTGDPDDPERAAELVRKKLRTLPRDLPADKATARLVGLLARRGYRPALAYTVVKQELAAAEHNAAADRVSADPFAPEPGGVDAETPPLAVESAHDEAEQAADLVRRKIRTLPRNLPEDKIVNRLVGMLARRGYGQSLAYSVVRAELAHGFPSD